MAHDETLFRELLSESLSVRRDLELIAQVASGDDALDHTMRFEIDVILLGVEIPGRPAFDVARCVAERNNGTRIIYIAKRVLDRHIDNVLRFQCVRGFVTTTQSVRELVDAVREVANGRTHFAPELLARLTGVISSTVGTQPRSRANSLTPRELEILQFVARGLSQQVIASTMHLRPKTVNSHCVNIMKKLDIHDRVQLARYAIREGIVSA